MQNEKVGKATCGGCEFFIRAPAVVSGNIKGGMCHRVPPQVVVLPVQTVQGVGMSIQAHYPPVTSDAPACGEFRSAPPALGGIDGAH